MPRYVIEFRQRESTHWRLSGNRLSDGSVRRLRDIEFPSLEAAQAEARQQQSRHTSLTYRARDTEPERGATMPEVATAVPQSRAIRIYRRGSQWVVDSGGRPKPEMRFLAPYLPAPSRTITSRAYTVEDALALGMNPQMLTSALSAWFVEHPNQGSNIVVSEGITELPDNNAFMALGDYIYQMIPVRQVKTGKAVRLMREKMKKEVETLAVSLKQQASNEAQSIIDQANTKAGQIRLEAERARIADNAMLKFPQWLSGIPVKAKAPYGEDIPIQYAMQGATIIFTGITHGTKKWATKSDVPRAVTVNLWLPLSGDAERVHLDDIRGSLPHIYSNSACMKLGEVVQPIISLERLQMFRNQIVRAMATINIASLLQPDPARWIPDIVKMLPDPIRVWLQSYPTLDQQSRRQEIIDLLPPGDNVETPQETWSVR
jgi:hypothetical protein